MQTSSPKWCSYSIFLPFSFAPLFYSILHSYNVSCTWYFLTLPFTIYLTLLNNAFIFTPVFMMSLPVLVASFDEEGLRDGHMEGNLSAAEVSQIILTVFLNQNGDRTDFIDVSLASELTLNWILNIYDP